MPEQGSRILIVDDDDDVRDALSMILEAEGYRVACSANGRQALEYLGSHPPPCVVLLDLMMPVMNGWEFLSAKDADASFAPIPVVVVTAAGESGTRQLRDRKILAKPVAIQELLDTVSQYCGKNP